MHFINLMLTLWRWLTGVSWKRPTSDPYDDAPLHAIRAEIEADPDGFLLNTEPLTNDDLILIGSLVQLYNFADLNARRIIDALRHAALGPHARNGGVIQDAQVYEKLIEAAKMLPETTDMRRDLIKAASTLQMHQLHRHHFAHWATRRIQGHDAFFMMTYKAQESTKRLGKPSEPYETIYALMPLPALRAEMDKLKGHSEWLAREAGRVFVGLDNFKNHFDEVKAADRAAKYKAGMTKKGAKGPPER